MVGMTTYTATELLKAITDQGAFTEVTAPYLALFTVAGSLYWICSPACCRCFVECSNRHFAYDS